MSCQWNNISEPVRAAAQEAGAFRTGFCRAEAVDDEAAMLYSRRAADGAFADMSYLCRYDDVRRDPRLLLEGAQTIICCAFSYYQPKPHPYLADYALGDDYHDVLRRRLSEFCERIKSIAGGETRICIDTAPLRERYWAARAGLGVIGLNNQLIIPGAGSRFFLAEVLWTVSLPADRPLQPGECLRCGACVRACPGKALDGKGSLDCSRCLSYLSIEYRGDFSEHTPPFTGVYGCDVCQRVCPMNTNVTPPEALPEFAQRAGYADLTPDDIIAMEQADFSRLFKGSAIKRAKLAGLQRNARHLKEGK
jgi:epoxyqueuosine reductase